MEITGKCPHCGASIKISDLFQGGVEEYKKHIAKENEELIAVKLSEIESLKKQELARAEDLLRKREDELTKRADERVQSASKEAAGNFQKTLDAMNATIKTLQAELQASREDTIRSREEAAKARIESAEKLSQEKMQLMREIEERRIVVEREAAEKARAESTVERAKLSQENDDLRKKIELLSNSAKQGSMERQGEAIELNLEHELKQYFREDEIKPVPKGVSGADLIQSVVQAGIECGKIIWEIKNTKAWAEDWVTKLKDDVRASGGAIGILATQVFPREHAGKTAVFYNGIWVVSYSVILPLAEAVRAGMIETVRAKSIAGAKQDKAGMVYDYLTSKEFQQLINAMSETYQSLLADLNKERMWYDKIFAQREMGIKKLASLTMTMHGSIVAIAGTSGEVPSLSFENEPTGNK